MHNTKSLAHLGDISGVTESRWKEVIDWLGRAQGVCLILDLHT